MIKKDDLGNNGFSIIARKASSGRAGRFQEDIMRNKIKGVVLGVFMLCAVVTTVFALTGTSNAENQFISGEAVGSGNRYVLRDYEGLVAVFVENEPELPMTVTDIQVSTLRELDKQLLETGLKIDSHEKLVMTLEDLGS